MQQCRTFRVPRTKIPVLTWQAYHSTLMRFQIPWTCQGDRFDVCWLLVSITTIEKHLWQLRVSYDNLMEDNLTLVSHSWFLCPFLVFNCYAMKSSFMFQPMLLSCSAKWTLTPTLIYKSHFYLFLQWMVCSDINVPFIFATLCCYENFMFFIFFDCECKNGIEVKLLPQI